MKNVHHLTDDELLRQLAMRNDLTRLELELQDRLFRARQALQDEEERNRQLELEVQRRTPA